MSWVACDDDVCYVIKAGVSNLSHIVDCCVIWLMLDVFSDGLKFELNLVQELHF